MASFCYDDYILRKGGNGVPTDLNDSTLGMMFIDELTGEVPNQTSDQDVADRASNAQVPLFASCPNLVGNAWTVVSHVGMLDANDLTFPLLSGDVSSSLDLFVDTNVDTTSTLIANFDDYTGLPFTPSGANVVITFAATGILRDA